MIEVQHLTKRYGNFTAVDDISFSVSTGEILGFLGPNGAGKSTTMNMLTGYLSATEGTVTIGEYDILEHPNEAKKHIGYLPELPPLYLDMTVHEYLSFLYDLKKVTYPKEPHIAEICGLVGIAQYRDKLIKKLSKGYRQRVGIAQALLGNPDVLILDEPPGGLDPNQIIEIRNLIRALGKDHTVIFSSHILSEIQAVCERIIVISHGKIIADDTAENLARGISDDHSYTLRVVGGKEKILGLLQGTEGVAGCYCAGAAEAGSFEFVVEPEEGADFRLPLFEKLRAENLPLIYLKSNEPSLEEAFIRLTANDAAAREGSGEEEDAAAPGAQPETDAPEDGGADAPAEIPADGTDDEKEADA